MTSISNEMTRLDQFILNLRTFRIHLVAFLISVLVFIIFRTKFFFQKFQLRIFREMGMKLCLHKICNYKSKSVCKSKMGIALRTGTDRYEPSRLFKITIIILWKSLIVSDTGILGFKDFKNDKNFRITCNFKAGFGNNS